MAANKTKETDSARLEALEEIMAKQEETIESLKAENAKLSEQVGAATSPKAKSKPKPKPPEKTFTVSGTKYRFLAVQFRHQGQIVKAVDALEDKEILKYLAENNSRVITEAK